MSNTTILNPKVGFELEAAVISHTGKMLAMCNEIPDNGKGNPINVKLDNYSRKPILIHHDNVLLEATLGPISIGHCNASLGSLFSTMNSWVHNKYNNLTTVLATPAIKYTGDRTPETEAIGCSPDINIYGDTDVDMSEFEAGIRTCGLHINLDTPDDDDYKELLCKNMDRQLFLIMKKVEYPISRDQEIKRRRIYGRAGSCRMYDKASGDLYTGLEYRVPSPTLLMFPSVDIGRMIENVYEETNKGRLIAPNTSDSTIRKGINTLKFG